MKAKKKYGRASGVLAFSANFLFLLLTWLGSAVQEQGKSFALAFSPQSGQNLVYVLNTRMNSEGKSSLGKNLSLNASASGIIDFAIRQVSAENVYTELTSPGIQVSFQTLETQDEFTLAASKDNPVQIVLDKTGRIREVKNTEALEAQNFMNLSILDILQNYLPALPDRPVAIGDFWKDRRRMSIPFQGLNLVAEVDVLFLLTDVLPSSEGRMALIQASYTVILSGSSPLEEVVASFGGKGFGSGIMNFSIDRGYFKEYRLDYSVDGAIVMRKAETNLFEWPFSLSVNASLSLLETREAGPVRMAR